MNLSFKEILFTCLLAWLLSNDKPRISKYPYETEEAGPLMNILPISIQHALSKWVGSRILQLNTGHDYFPDQFMVGGERAFFLKKLSLYDVC